MFRHQHTSIEPHNVMVTILKQHTSIWKNVSHVIYQVTEKN